eukprot:GHVU01210688.1.p1 GENE.GHVU01210688.1~~GHVU01210688.1.p1  ORF type:complete len:465 (+),score=88.86 GHVU01210688.1:109-1395(+)
MRYTDSKKAEKVFGPRNENENVNAASEAQTIGVRRYTLSHITIIDTPGLEDSRVDDLEHLERMTKALDDEQEISAFIIVVKGNENRLLNSTARTIRKLLALGGRAFIDRFVFVFTFPDNRGLATNGKTVVKNLLEDIFKECNVRIRFTDDDKDESKPRNVFVVDNSIMELAVVATGDEYDLLGNAGFSGAMGAVRRLLCNAEEIEPRSTDVIPQIQSRLRCIAESSVEVVAKFLLKMDLKRREAAFVEENERHERNIQAIRSTKFDQDKYAKEAEETWVRRKQESVAHLDRCEEAVKDALRRVNWAESESKVRIAEVKEKVTTTGAALSNEETTIQELDQKIDAVAKEVNDVDAAITTVVHQARMAEDYIAENDIPALMGEGGATLMQSLAYDKNFINFPPEQQEQLRGQIQAIPREAPRTQATVGAG